MDFLGKTYEISGTDLLIAGLVILVMFIHSFYNTYKIRQISTKHRRMINNFSGNNIENSLNKFMDKVEATYIKGIEIENRCNDLDKKILKCIQKIGVVRYNAFSDTGSDLSFAIALLDASDDGFVINGIYSRDGSCTYAKPIYKGNTKYVLSDEEERALSTALSSSNRLQ